MADNEEEPQIGNIFYILNEAQHVDNVEDMAKLGREFNKAVPIFIQQVNDHITKPYIKGVQKLVEQSRYPRR